MIVNLRNVLKALKIGLSEKLHRAWKEADEAGSNGSSSHQQHTTRIRNPISDDHRHDDFKFGMRKTQTSHRPKKESC